MGGTKIKNKNRSNMKKQKPITHDLFEIDECVICNGEGWVEVKGKEHEERTEDCDNCNGTGIN
tara:strand:- start:429 stop:617 length:189 start_codon:yes stop_codon:yes gene_type:complete